MTHQAEHGIENGPTQEDLAVTEATRAADNAGLKKRMRISTEAIVKMVSPVFLAACVSLAKVDMTDQPVVRDSLSIVAAITLGSGIGGLLPLSFPNWFLHKHILVLISMACIHLCGIFLMVLAFLIVHLVSKGDLVLLSIPLALIAAADLILCILTALNVHKRGATELVHPEFADQLENSVDLSAAIIFLLFLGFGALLLGGQYSTIVNLHEKDSTMLRLLALSICLSFCICILGMLFMLVCMVPQMSNGYIIEVFNYILGGFLATIVLLITLGKLKNWGVAIVAFMLSILPFICGVIVFPCFGGSIERGNNEEVKPASLDLTKVAFTGFLTISVYTIGENSPVSFHESSCWFIFFTAVAVNNCLGWRLITHQKNPTAAWFTAGHVASLAAQIYIILAVVPFLCMAYGALLNITTTPSCHAPSPGPSPAPA